MSNILGFLFPHRVQRFSFVLRFIASTVCFSVVSFWAAHTLAAASAKPVPSAAFLVPLLLYCFYYLAFVWLPRLRDIGLPPIAIVVGFAPIVALPLGLFAPSGWWRAMTEPQTPPRRPTSVARETHVPSDPY